MVRKTCPVDVISVCSASGEIRPLRLRVEDEEQGLIRVAVCTEIPHPRPLLVPDGQGVLIFRSGNYGEIVVLWW